MRRLLPLIVCLLFYFSATAQETEWMQDFDGNPAFNNFAVTGLAIDSSNDYISGVTINSSINYYNTQITNANNSTNVVIRKFNSEGKLIWLYYTSAYTNSNISLLDLCTNNSGEIFILIRFAGSIDLGNNILLSSQYTGHRFAVLKLDSTGIPQWFKRIQNKGDNANITPTLAKIKYKNNFVFVSLSVSGDYLFDGDNTSIITNQVDIIFGKYDVHGNFVKSAKIGGSGNEQGNDFDINSKDQIILPLRTQSMEVNGSFINAGSYILTIDSNFTPLNYYEVQGSIGVSTLIKNTDYNNGFILASAYRDSFSIRDSSYQNYYVNYIDSGNSSVNALITNFSNDSTANNWVMSGYSPNPVQLTIAKQGLCMQKSFIYMGGGTFNQPIYFNNQFIQSSVSNSGFYFIKADSLGNLLWAFGSSNSGGVLTNLAVDLEGNLIVSGFFTSKVKIFNDSLLNNSVLNEPFLAKITDYSITRGDVFEGPYCAGDSILIPYTKVGTYDTDSNYFIAELSDENGNFDGAEFELGRLQTDDSGTIIGTLPLFEVASSGNYRIRVISTHPPVQSYYIYDVLRLLIFSRDKADPGGTETICSGDTIQLNTYGGTAWEWSPAYRMDDSTLRQPKVRPDSTFTYRIVISDSSGCGEPDTAFKTIVVRADPKVNIPMSDTTLCMNAETEIIAHFEQGDTGHYFWLWFEIDNNNMPLVIKFASNDSTHFFYQNQIKGSDTISYKLPAHQKDSQRIMLVLRDYCSPKADTAYYTIHVNKEQPLAMLSPPDSAICPGTDITLQAQFTDGNEQGYEWTWYNSDGIALQTDSGKTNDNLLVTPIFDGQNPQSYFLILQDNCSPLKDTAHIDIYPREPINVFATPQDTLLCAGQEVTFTATGTGGFSENYQFRWEDAETGELLGEEETLIITASVTQEYRIILTDGCMPEGDSATVTLRVNPPLEAAILRELLDNNPATDTTVCFGSELEYHARGFGGDSSGYSFSWYLNDSLVSTASNVMLSFSKQDVTEEKLTLILTDNCTSLSDTQSISFNILPPLEVSAIIPDTLCRGEEITLTAFPSGGIPKNYQYQWLVDGTLVGTDSIIIHPFTFSLSPFTTLQLILSDQCSNPNDTFTKSIIFRPELNLSLATSNPCANPSAILTATPQGGKSEDYSIQWFDAANNLLGEEFTLSVTPLGVQTYTAILNDGCTEKADTATLTIGSVPEIEVTANPVEGCEPLPVTFEIQTNYPDGYTWSLNPGDGNPYNNLRQTQLTVIFPTGTYSPMASITTDFGCSNNFDNLFFDVFPKPQAYFTFHPESPSLDSPFVSFKNLSVGALNYFWNIEPIGDFDEFEPYVTYPDTGLYHITLIAETDKGCLDTFSSSLRVLPQYHVYLPSAFSPNGDGLNDNFRPVVAGVAEMSFQIFNRWGQMVFMGKNNDTWDGTFNGKLVPEGIYVYSVQVLNMLGEKQSFSGSLTLLR